MRSTIFLLSLMLLFGCAAKKPAEDDYVTRVGVVKSKAVVDPEQARSQGRVNTSVSASVSSGGGFSIGLGFLLGSWSKGAAEKPAVRYVVELADGEQVTIYHESDLFEVEDCVEIRSIPGDDRNPPQMKRSPGACQGGASG